MTRAPLVLALLAASFASGCYATTVRSGLKPEPKPAIERDALWHHGVVLGIAEVSGPYDLTELCPNGWSEISTETSFLNGLVELITGSLYNPQTVTVRCAAADAVVSTTLPPPASAAPSTP